MRRDDQNDDQAHPAFRTLLLAQEPAFGGGKKQASSRLRRMAQDGHSADVDWWEKELGNITPSSRRQVGLQLMASRSMRLVLEYRLECRPRAGLGSDLPRQRTHVCLGMSIRKLLGALTNVLSCMHGGQQEKVAMPTSRNVQAIWYRHQASQPQGIYRRRTRALGCVGIVIYPMGRMRQTFSQTRSLSDRRSAEDPANKVRKPRADTTSGVGLV